MKFVERHETKSSYPEQLDCESYSFKII